MVVSSIWRSFVTCFTDDARIARRSGLARQLRLESLEDRQLLAIMWMNQGTSTNDSDNFAAVYGNATALIAREIVTRAIDDWESVVTDFNYDGDNDPGTTNTYNLTVNAAVFGGTLRGSTAFPAVNAAELPTSTTITMDDNGGGDGWFFDTTPIDDAEFTAVANSREGETGVAFQASFVDVTTPSLNYNDFYRTIVHEIGHALGIYLVSTATSPLLDRLFLMTTDIGDDPNSAVAADRLRVFNGAGGTVTFTTNGGGHIYEGNPGDAAAIVSHPNELMNPGRTVPPAGGNPIPTTRQFISDLDVQLLHDAYGYTVTLPSIVDTAHATLDSQTGTLLVQGRTGVLDDEIVIDTVGDQIRVRVQWPTGAPTFIATELFPVADVTQIVIARNGGNDTVDVAEELESILQEVQYVVSSNQDNADAGAMVGDGIVDLSAVIPGNQVSLRAAIVDANGTAGGAARSIYLPRGQYRLQAQPSTETTAAPNASINDFDILGNLTLIGTGAGASVIDASALDDDNGGVAQAHDRIFEISGAGRSLSLSNLTLTGGNVTTFGGGAIYVDGGASVNVNRIAVVGNTTTEVGGGIRSSGVNTSLTVRNSVFTDNVSTNAGGAIAVIPGNVNTFTFGNNIFARNSGGGGHRNIYTTSTSHLNLKNEGNNVADNNALNVFNANLGDLIDTTTLAADLRVVTNVADVIDAADGTAGLSLREAVVAANAGNDTIWLPAWKHFLTRQDAVAETTQDATIGDLDITGVVTLIGAGAGLSVVHAGRWNDRIFEVRGATGLSRSLTASRLTLTGGHATTFGGGAILVYDGGAVTLDQVAVVNNHTTAIGGGIRAADPNTQVTVRNSVFTGNVATGGLGGAISFSPVTGSGQLRIGSTIFALNTANGNNNVYSPAGLTSEGKNLLDSDNVPNSYFNGVGDVVDTSIPAGSLRVVTSVGDSYNRTDDAYLTSIRDAIDNANADAALNYVWLPAWNFGLTRAREVMPDGIAGSNATDTDVAFGDLDVHESLVVRGINGLTRVGWRAGIVDTLFDLLGDYNGDGLGNGLDDGTADTADYTIWRNTLGSDDDLRADGNDNGIVDQADWQIWKSSRTNTLTVTGVN